jgi:tryptophanase
VIPNNAHFDTTRANIEHSGAEAIDLLTEAGRSPAADRPFKGDMDLAALERLLDERADDVPAVMITITCNSNGGQPVSLGNVRRARALCDRFGKPLFLDAARFAENAWLVKQREPGQSGRPVLEIAREFFDLSDGATISAKKDGLVNIGGVLLIRDPELFQRASDLLILTEGFVTYGGLAGRDLEAMAIGFEEVLDEDYLRYRIRSVEYLGEGLIAAGVPIVRPPGGHAIYIDADAFCPHLPRPALPGQALACALYEHAGIRSCEVGTVMVGPQAAMELVRLAIPRRTYTQSHVDYVVEAVSEVFAHAERIPGLHLVGWSGALRHFTARFEVAGAPVGAT